MPLESLHAETGKFIWHITHTYLGPPSIISWRCKIFRRCVRAPFMKIFFIGSYKEKPTTGGHLYNMKMVEALKQTGHYVKIISVFQMPRLFRNKLFSFLYPLFLLVQNIPDLIIQISDSAARYFLFSLIARLLVIPAIQIVHHIEYPFIASGLRQKLIPFFMKFNLKQARLIIVVSEYTKSQVLAIINPRIEKKIIIIRPMVDIKFLTKMKHNYQNKKQWNLLSIGIVTERKGYHYLLEALGDLKEYSYTISIVGAIQEREYYDSLLDLVKRLNLEGKVFITSYLSSEELQALYLKSDVFVHPSLLEGYGIVLCEALCYGLPVVATRVGAIPEIVRHQYNGLLVEPRNPQALKNALMMLMSKPALAERLSNNAISSCKHLVGWDRMQQNFLRLIKKIELREI